MGYFFDVSLINLFEYRTGLIYPGPYTVALVCETDDPELDEDLAFNGVANVDAIAGAKRNPA